MSRDTRPSAQIPGGISRNPVLGFAVSVMSVTRHAFARIDLRCKAGESIAALFDIGGGLLQPLACEEIARPNLAQPRFELLKITP